jgi:hypothetical protein
MWPWAETGMPVLEYLRLFEEKVTEILDTSTSTDYEVSVAAATASKATTTATTSHTFSQLGALPSGGFPAGSRLVGSQMQTGFVWS